MATTWKTDSTFYPSPQMAMEASAETLGYVAVINPAGDRPDAIAVMDVNPDSPTYSRIVGRTDCRTPGTSCTISAGTPAARRSVPRCRTRTWSGATWSCPASAPRASTCST